MKKLFLFYLTLLKLKIMKKLFFTIMICFAFMACGNASVPVVEVEDTIESVDSVVSSELVVDSVVVDSITVE